MVKHVKKFFLFFLFFTSILNANPFCFAYAVAIYKRKKKVN